MKGVMMVRTQIQVTEMQSQILKQLAAQRGVSLAELIRQAIELLIQKAQEPEIDIEAKRRRARQISGKFRSGVPDLAVNHDYYLDEAYAYFHQSAKLADENLR